MIQMEENPMTDLPIVTRLTAEQLHGYAEAMAEAADACFRVSDMRDWALDRAALARGIILRETAQVEGWGEAWDGDGASPDTPAPPPSDEDERLITPPGTHLAPPTEAEQQAHRAIAAMMAPPTEAEQQAHRQIAAMMAAAPAPSAAPGCEAIAGTDQAAPARPPPSAPQRSMRDISEAEKEQMRQLYMADTPVREIAQRFNVAFTSLYSMAAARGWKFAAEPSAPPPAPAPARPAAIDDDMEAARIDVLKHGRGAKWIAEEYGWELPFAQKFCAEARAKAAA
jgi:transposase-like protein